jgi:hypothetical protein
MQKILAIFSFPVLIILSFLAIAPMDGASHLVTKSHLLLMGNLVKPIDIFDLLFHSSALILLSIKSIYFLTEQFQSKNNKK